LCYYHISTYYFSCCFITGDAGLTLDSLRLLVRLAADESTLVRKAALTSICGLFEGSPSNDQLQKYHSNTISPLKQPRLYQKMEKNFED
jgi:hypothetical protein